MNRLIILNKNPKQNQFVLVINELYGNYNILTISY